MAYRQPGVTVTENFTGLTPALALFALTNINVGPAFQVVTKAAVSGGPYVGSQITYAYPGKMAGTLIDARPPNPLDLIGYPVTIFLKNVVISYATASTGTVLVGNLNQFVDATSGVFSNVRPGDIIVVTSGVNNGGSSAKYTVRKVINANLIQTNETFVGADTTISYSLLRPETSTASVSGYYQLPYNTSGLIVDPDAGVTLPTALTYEDADLGVQPIVSASVLMSYRAQRLEESADVFTYTTVQQLEADFGIDQIVPENPVAFAAYLALSNTAPSTDLLALNYNYLQDEVLSYAAAFSILENHEEYVINVLTHNTAVHTALSAHVTKMSEPLMKMERAGITNRTIVLSSVVVDDVTVVAPNGVSGAGHDTLTSNNSHFLTDGVVPGMFVVVHAPSAAAGRWPIASVNSQTSITLGPIAPAASDTTSGLTFHIEKNLTLEEQASYIAAYAASIGNRRLVVTWPDVVKIPVGSSIRELPGYFLGCGLGGLTTGLPTQQGFTNQNVAIYTGVKHSTKYFTNTQLNTMAAGGVMVFVQDVLDVSAVYIRHQLTSDVSAIKFQEYSITKNVDFIAKFIRNQHKQFIGKYNIVDGAFDDLKLNAKGILGFLKNSTIRPKIGGVINSGKLVSIVQDPNNIDTILETYQLSIPIPLNNLDITINV